MVRFKFLAGAFVLGLASLTVVQADENAGSVRPAAVQHLIANSAADWKLDVQLNHTDGVYVVGEQMTIEVQSPRECYVHIVNVNPQGEVNVLWPMDHRTSNRMTSGTTVIFPDRGNHPNYVFEAAAPVGRELIVCFATTAPLNLKSPDDARMLGEFLNEIEEVTPHPLTRLRSFVTKVEPKKSGWTATAFELFTTEKDTRISTHSTSGSTTAAKPDSDGSSVADQANGAAVAEPAVQSPAQASNSSAAPPAPDVVPESSEVPQGEQTSSGNHEGLFAPATGNVTVQFPGAYRTQPSIVEVIARIKVKTTITMQTEVEGVMIFSEAVIESPVDCFNEHAALNGVAADWNERFEAGDDQIKPVKLGRLEGREYRGKGKDGMAKWVRVFVDPVSRITYFVGCCGSDSFIERPTSAAFLNSLQVIR